MITIETEKEHNMRINAAPPVSFKMRLSDDLQEKLKKEEFKNSDKRFEKYNNLFQAAYPYTEDTTVLHAKTDARGNYELYVSSELAPGVTYHLDYLNKPKNLAKALLLLCQKKVDTAEKRLFFSVIKEKVRNYEPIRGIKDIADSFEKNKAVKKSEFLKMLDNELETRDYLTDIGGAMHY